MVEIKVVFDCDTTLVMCMLFLDFMHVGTHFEKNASTFFLFIFHFIIFNSLIFIFHICMRVSMHIYGYLYMLCEYM